MTIEEAKEVFLNRGYIQVKGGRIYDGDKWRESVFVISKWLEQEPCGECINRQTAIDALSHMCSEDKNGITVSRANVNSMLRGLPPATSQPKTGQWLRMSDLSEEEDDRYKCSHCGNVVHYKLKHNLYTFNSWCGRCGSDNGQSENKE